MQDSSQQPCSAYLTPQVIAIFFFFFTFWGTSSSASHYKMTGLFKLMMNVNTGNENKIVHCIVKSIKAVHNTKTSVQ